MHRILFTFVLLTVGLVAIAYTADINGVWKGSMPAGPEGALEMTFTFKVDGENLTGSEASPMGEMPLTGKVDGNNFSFNIDFGGMQINNQCTVSGDSVYLTMPGMEGGDMQMILLRDKTAK